MTKHFTKNILATYHKANPDIIVDGIDWYLQANKSCRIISDLTGLNIRIVVGVVAALSPNNKWSKNVIDAQNLCLSFINGGNIDEVKVSTYGAMKRKALDILELSHEYPLFSSNRRKGNALYLRVIQVLNGQKITAFYECIMGEDSCCIDGHAKNIYYGKRYNLTDPKTNVTKKEFRVISEAYRAATKVINKMHGTQYKAYHVQAITWSQWRIDHGIS